jgi:TPR repeat protein
MGRGIAQNVSEAVKYYKLSADQGDPVGQANYGSSLEHGTGIAPNVSEAVKYYKLAADQGHALGQRNYERCVHAT